MEKNIELSSGKLHYFDSLQDKTPIIMIHGNSCSSSTFIPQFESQLAQNFRLLALDLPGHGNSDHLKSNKDSYSIPFFAQIVREWIEKLNLNSFFLVGHSLGGHIAIETIPHLPQALGLFIFGTPPLGNPPDFASAFLPNPLLNSFLKAENTKEEVRNAVRQFLFNENPNLMDIFEQNFLKTDPKVRADLFASIGSLQFHNELEIISQLKCPLAIVHGELDKLISFKYLTKINAPTLWRREIQTIQNSGHLPNWETMSEFNHLLCSFIQEMS